MADYKKLALLISENKRELCAKLEGLSLPSDADKIKQLCIDYVGTLTRKDAEYMNQLSLLEQDLLSPVLRVMDTLYSSDIELSQKVSSLLSKKGKQPCNQQSQSKNSISKEYGPALVGAAGGTLLATICKPSSWGVILFGSVISAIIGKVLYSLYLDNNNNVIAEVGEADVHYPEYKLTNVDVNNIVKGLEAAGECIDKVLLTYRRHLEIVQDEYSHKIESFNLDKKYIGILECYQTILGNISSMEITPVVKDTIKQINNSLSGQGFKAVHYSEDFQNLFDVRIGDIPEPEEFKPAILKYSDKKEILILKGEVVLPQNKQL